jgi:hypothetical protein
MDKITRVMPQVGWGMTKGIMSLWILYVMLIRIFILNSRFKKFTGEEAHKILWAFFVAKKLQKNFIQ